MAHLHSVYDNDTHFKIDPVTRQIANESGKVVLMQNDHNSERFTFEIPRYIDGHDMSVCNKVEVHFINLKADKTEKNADVYPVEDLQISPDSEDVVICSWLISQNATKYAGSLNFVLRYACLTGDVIDYQWYTDIHKGISVSESISNTETVATEYSDVLEEWYRLLFEKAATGMKWCGEWEGIQSRYVEGSVITHKGVIYVCVAPETRDTPGESESWDTITTSDITDEQIAQAVEDYMAEHPVSGGNVDLTGVVKSVNGRAPDENGNVEIAVSGGTAAVAVTDKPYAMQNIGVLYENPEGYDYVAWCPGNLRYDAVNDRYVSLVYGSTKHGAGTTALFVSYINPKTYEATAPVRCYTDDGATALTGSTAFWIDDDGTYKMLYKYTDNKTYLFTSVDGGVNWTKGDAVSGFSGSPWGITKLSNGRLIFGDDVTKVGIYYSDNGGINWTQVIPETAGGGYEAEACILELEPGKLIAIARYSMSGIGYSISGDSEPALVSYSEDYGTSWTAWKKSSTITNMNASACTGIVHNGMVDIFAASRWYWHGSYSNTDYVNTGKTGAITHYTATVENALADNFTNNGVLTYANAVGDTSSQDFHSPCLAAKGDEILLMWFDRIYPYTEEVTSHYFARGGVGGLMNYAPNDEVVSVVFPYSSAMVEKLLRKQYTELMVKINNIVIAGGGTPEDSEDPENPTSFIFNGCIMNLDYLDSTKYDVENMTLTDSINGEVGTFCTASNGNTKVTEFPEIRDTSLGFTYLGFPENTLSKYLSDDNCEFTIELAIYVESDDELKEMAGAIQANMFFSNGGGTNSLRITAADVNQFYLSTDGSMSNAVGTLEGSNSVFYEPVTNLPRDVLRHGTFVFKSDGTVSIYEDGEYIGREIMPDTFVSWGGTNLTRKFCLCGFYKTVRIYNRALTDDEVLNNYNYELQSIM